MRLVYQNGKSYINYISSCGSSVLIGEYVGLNTAKLTLFCNELCHISKNRDLNMMEYFNFFLSFTHINSGFEISQGPGMQRLVIISEIMHIQLFISKRIDGCKVNNAINS